MHITYIFPPVRADLPHYYVTRGDWEKEHRGIYRLRQFPEEPSSEYMLWSLWSCDRNGEPQGIYSHETALCIYDLTDLNPSKLTMTVPQLLGVTPFDFVATTY